jgi:hypothetical protein
MVLAQSSNDGLVRREHQRVADLLRVISLLDVLLRQYALLLAPRGARALPVVVLVYEMRRDGVAISDYFSLRLLNPLFALFVRLVVCSLHMGVVNDELV